MLKYFYYKPAWPLNVAKHRQVSALCLPGVALAATLSPQTITSLSSPPDARYLPPLLQRTQFTQAENFDNV